MNPVTVVEPREDCWSVVAFTRAGWETWLVNDRGVRTLVEHVDLEEHTT